MEKGGLDYFPQLLDLLLTTTDITVGHVWLLLNLHEHKVLQLILEMTLIKRWKAAICQK